MPYSLKAHRLFEGIAHGSIPPREGLTRGKAATLASEGVKKTGHKMSRVIKRKK